MVYCILTAFDIAIFNLYPVKRLKKNIIISLKVNSTTGFIITALSFYAKPIY